MPPRTARGHERGSAMAYIEFSDVTKVYGSGEGEVRALDGASFEVERGELAVILGASGAGKTTALNILGGMDTATSGRVVVDGRDIGGASEDQLVEYRRADVGFVFQFYNLVPNLTALENVELASQICPDSLDAAECLAKVGLSKRTANFPAQLSGGEQQRVSIARAIARHPQVYLFDDSFSALDYQTDAALRQALAKQTHDATVIIVAQRLSTILHADQILVLDKGRIIQRGRHEELMEQGGLYADFIRIREQAVGWSL